MELLWIYYNGLKSSRYILLLQLGIRGNKICGLDAKLVSDSERLKIIHGVINLSLEGAIRWINTHCPLAYKKAYRELSVERAVIQSRHKIDPAKLL